MRNALRAGRSALPIAQGDRHETRSPPRSCDNCTSRGDGRSRASHQRLFLPRLRHALQGPGRRGRRAAPRHPGSGHEPRRGGVPRLPIRRQHRPLQPEPLLHRERQPFRLPGDLRPDAGAGRERQQVLPHSRVRRELEGRGERGLRPCPLRQRRDEHRLADRHVLRRDAHGPEPFADVRRPDLRGEARGEARPRRDRDRRGPVVQGGRPPQLRAVLQRTGEAEQQRQRLLVRRRPALRLHGRLVPLLLGRRLLPDEDLDERLRRVRRPVRGAGRLRHPGELGGGHSDQADRRTSTSRSTCSRSSTRTSRPSATPSCPT